MDRELPIESRRTSSNGPGGSGDGRLLLSVVVPCFNEEEVICDTNRRLAAVLAHAPLNFEIIYVDDGSSDSTPELLRQLQESDERVRVVRFSRNFGHQIAITAGLEHASGDAVVIIDADLQDPPEVILEFVEKWMDGYDVVYGVRAEREGETAFKLWTAKVFYRCIARLSDTRIPVDTGDFRLMDRRVVNALLGMPERDRFVRGMVSWLGFSQIGISYHREARTAGTTKFSFFKMLRFAMDGIFSFSVLPLRIATWIGFAASAIAILGVVIAVVERLLGVHGLVKGWTSILIAVLFIGGVQLICMGIIGEYVGRTYGESKRRPLYVLRERIGFDAREGRSPERRQTRIAAFKG
ncbi:MAG TPA: glycosyltransferase family 2 protein [Candidatus Acidoferrales bacterium]|nr:glycosyltransferase family 2 protein [Candidatus Acidoferrales bacterium]